jgi:hypothetical protein
MPFFPFAKKTSEFTSTLGQDKISNGKCNTSNITVNITVALQGAENIKTHLVAFDNAFSAFRIFLELF